MDELGVSAWDLDGNFIGIEVTLRLLNDALATCTQEQKTNFESAIGGKTQLDTLQALLSGLNEEYAELKDTVTNSDGALNKLAETMQDNAKGNVTKLKSQLEGLGIQIGNNLLPHLNDLLEYVSNIITWFGNLDEGTQKSIIKFGLLTFAGGGLLKGIGSLTTGIGGLIKSGSSVVQWASKFFGGMNGAKVVTEAVAGATSLAGGSAGLGTLVSGFGSAVVAAAPFIAGATAIGVAGYGIYKAMTKEVVPSVDLCGDVIEENTVMVKDMVKSFKRQNLKSHDKERTYKVIKSELEKTRYIIKEHILNTMDYSDLPQNRERIYIIGFLYEQDAVKFDLFDKLESYRKLKSKEDRIKDIKEIIDYDLSKENYEKYYYTKAKYPGYFLTYDEYNEIPLDKRNAERINLDEQINEMYEFYQVRRGMYVRKNMSGVCSTLTANMGTGGHNVPLIKVKDGIRKLTPSETFKLQGFPVGNGYSLPAEYRGKIFSDSHLYKQAGNAVSVPVVQFLAREILKKL